MPASAVKSSKSPSSAKKTRRSQQEYDNDEDEDDINTMRSLIHNSQASTQSVSFAPSAAKSSKSSSSANKAQSSQQEYEEDEDEDERYAIQNLIHNSQASTQSVSFAPSAVKSSKSSSSANKAQSSQQEYEEDEDDINTMRSLIYYSQASTQRTNMTQVEDDSDSSSNSSYRPDATEVARKTKNEMKRRKRFDMNVHKKSARTMSLMSRTHLHPIYHNSHDVRSAKNAEVFPIVHPSLLFPQAKPSTRVRSNNSDDIAILHSLFYDCYYSHDYLGALKILETLAEVVALDVRMFQYYIDIVCSIDVAPVTSVLETSFLKISLKGKHLLQEESAKEYYKRVNHLLHVVVERLVLSDDIDVALNLLQSRASYPGFAHYTNFRALHANVLLMKLMTLAVAFNNLERNISLPSIEAVLQTPILVCKYFMAFERRSEEKDSDSELSSLSDGQDRDPDDELNDDVNDILAEANKVKQDYAAIITEIVASHDMITQLTVQYMYIGYLIGIGRAQQALEHSSTVYSNLKEHMDELTATIPLISDRSTLLGRCMYYHLYTKNMCASSARDSDAASLHDAITWVSNDAGSTDALYLAYLLKHFNYISSATYLKILADSFESRWLTYTQQDCSRTGESTCVGCPHEAAKLAWSLCRSMALTIGSPCSAMAPTDKSVPRASPVGASLPDEHSLLTEVSLHNTEGENHLSDRKWWHHSMLSFEQLANRETSVSIENTQLILQSLTHLESAGLIGNANGNISVWFRPDAADFGSPNRSRRSRHRTYSALYSALFQETAITSEALRDSSRDTVRHTAYDVFSGTQRVENESVYCVSHPCPKEITFIGQIKIGFRVFQQLSNLNLEQLTFQIVMSTYVNDGDQDTLFVVHGINVLLRHALHAYINGLENGCVLECLSFLRRSNINILRGAALADAIKSCKKYKSTHTKTEFKERKRNDEGGEEGDSEEGIEMDI